MDDVYTMKLRRHWQDMEEQYNSIESACISAHWMVEDNTAYPVELIDSQGAVVMTRDQMLERGQKLCE